jgi:hypothetical protein
MSSVERVDNRVQRNSGEEDVLVNSHVALCGFAGYHDKYLLVFTTELSMSSYLEGSVQRETDKLVQRPVVEIIFNILYPRKVRRGAFF